MAQNTTDLDPHEYFDEICQIEELKEMHMMVHINQTTNIGTFLHHHRYPRESNT